MDDRTRSLVAEAWLFNPSPKLYASDKYDKRIWVGELRGEALQLIWSRPLELFWPGINRIGAPWQQNAQDYQAPPPMVGVLLPTGSPA